MINEYQRRRDWLVPALNEIPGIRCDTPEGAFYVMPNMKGMSIPGMPAYNRASSTSRILLMRFGEARTGVTL